MWWRAEGGERYYHSTVAPIEGSEQTRVWEEGISTAAPFPYEKEGKVYKKVHEGNLCYILWAASGRIFTAGSIPKTAVISVHGSS